MIRVQYGDGLSITRAGLCPALFCTLLIFVSMPESAHNKTTFVPLATILIRLPKVLTTNNDRLHR